MIRSTSREAFHEIKENGLLSERRFQVYDVLYHHGPLTGNEVLKYLKKEYGIGSGNAPSIVSRLGELRSQGVVYEKGKTICSITGMRVIQWEVTKKLPTKLVKKKKIPCPHCAGTGYVKEGQLEMDFEDDIEIELSHET